MKNNANVFEIARSRMYSALNSFYIWRWLEQSRNIHIGEAKAKKNLEIINRYKFFFIPVIINSYKGFVTDLSIFYDSERYPETFSMGKLIKTLDGKLTKKELTSLKEEISNIKKKHKISINIIRDLRNKNVAHQVLKVKRNAFNTAEMEDLFIGTQKIIDLINDKYDNSTNSWKHAKEEVDKDMELLFNNLKIKR